jgi:hypothetical protein
LKSDEKEEEEIRWVKRRGNRKDRNVGLSGQMNLFIINPPVPST